ncbi:hypothetical protein SAMN05660642_03932 [Geodermatophilus siccatus]|uniref:Uncharacterized protein n=1 Tax=Geodermatophilus siccatus TaxID=1137991 RepID=A0A1G9Y892_9ACTN|nr:hypothetical protein [Geodermatophilus siccatus]SDN05329.1 hypothetical protein SAMN05660642_03932 [Geodermatophilus siccatus]
MSAHPTRPAVPVSPTSQEEFVSLPDVHVRDPLGGRRRNEPVVFTVPVELEGDLWTARTAEGDEVTCQVLRAQQAPGSTTLVAAVSFVGETKLTLTGPAAADVDGIRELPAREADAFVRLDTGVFDLEMCRGTAQGTGSSKWGLRHFSSTAEGVDLLPSGNNAIGGFYGPFFTPENGLINPPEHTTVEIEVVERGPVQHHYRMHGTVPDGLLPELRGKRFSIDWVFTHGSSHFTRVYRVDEFQTVINGRSVTNKITVGDEFESGQGSVVFDRFAALGGTRYRSGDPYAGQLADMVGDTLATSTSRSETFDRFRTALTGDIEAAHWDLYWRLFCVWEGALDEAEIRERLGRVRAASHVLADLPDRRWQLDAEPVDVSAVEHETVFAGPAAKTVEFHSETGRTMVWWTSAPSGAFQIVQRPQSGWVNWGTNGENECPELPVGVTVRTAYGQFADSWSAVADQLESPPVVTQS